MSSPRLRLFAFHDDVLYPAVEFAYDRGVDLLMGTVPPEHREAMADLADTLDDPLALFAAAKVEEALRWVARGRAIGYFPDSPPGELAPTFERAPLVAFPRSVWWRPENSAERNGTQEDVHDSESFAEAIGSNAFPTDSADRETFLQLLYFASRTEWEARIEEVWVFAEQFSLRPDRSFADDEVDGISWALTGPEPPFRMAGLPSDWRAVDLDAESTLDDYVVARQDALRSLRARIRVAAEWIGPDDASTIRLAQRRDAV